MYRQTGSTMDESQPYHGDDKRMETPAENQAPTENNENGGCYVMNMDSIQSKTQIPDKYDNYPADFNYVNEAFVMEIDKNKFSPPSYGKNTELGEESKTHAFNEFLLSTKDYMTSHRTHIKFLLRVILLILYNIYLTFAVISTWHDVDTWCDGVKFLVLITAVVYFVVIYKVVIKPFVIKPCLPCLEPIARQLNKLINLKYFSHTLWSIIWGGILVFLLIDTSNNRRRLISAGGLLILLLLGYIFSKHRRHVVWRHVFCGLLIQFCLGMISLRWNFGKAIFLCLGDKVKSFLAVSDNGSTFVFGYLVSGKQPIFAFKVLTVVIFFSFIVSMLYYYGIMQVIVVKMGWLLQQVIGTTACESVNAAANIFLGMTEAPLLIRPYLPTMTKSELHAVMTGGFATVAGSVLAAYIFIGINASHLLSASVMAAPAALAYSKLVYPETEESCTEVDNIKITKGSECNALEAAINGASTAVKMIASIAANLIAFIAFIALLDGIVQWLGSLVNYDFISFEWLLTKAFIPLSLMLGVDWDDSEKVANLIGLKNVVNEFVAYERLADFKKNNPLSTRSEAIATFALCGFSNIASIGIQLGSLISMAPDRKSDLSGIAVRAMIAGSVTCCITACVAGTLLEH